MNNKQLYRMLYTPKDNFSALREAEELVTNMKLLATSTGAIRYDKPNVQTSPSNDGMIISIERIMKAEDDLKIIRNKYVNNSKVIHEIGNLLLDPMDKEIFKYTWERYIDTRTIAYNLNMKPESVRKRKERIVDYLLTQYFDTIVDLSHHML